MRDETGDAAVPPSSEVPAIGADRSPASGWENDTSTSLHLPLPAVPRAGQESAFGALQAEILAEQAASLEYAGEQLKRSLTALAQATPGEKQAAALAAAREAFWSLIVQRDACGFRNPDEVIATYAVPAEVAQAVMPPPLVPLRNWT